MQRLQQLYNPEFLKSDPEVPGINQGQRRHQFLVADLGSPYGWWSQAGSNRRPPACKAGALPAELWPLLSMVGLGRFELPTSPLSGVRSNQLSYRPELPDSNDQTICCGHLSRDGSGDRFKGGDPAAGSPTATLLRLHPSHEPQSGERPPEG